MMNERRVWCGGWWTKKMFAGRECCDQTIAVQDRTRECRREQHSEGAKCVENSSSLTTRCTM
jgi:hypothetical protein